MAYMYENEDLKRNPIIADRLTQERLDFVVVSVFPKQDVFLQCLDRVTAVFEPLHEHGSLF
jgi:hypothetical protein